MISLAGKFSRSFSFLFLFFLPHYTLSETVNTPATVRIGIYAPFSGHSASIGRNILGGMELASEQLGSSTIHYEFYTLDRLSSKQSATPVLQKFIKAHQLQVLITDGDESGFVATSIAKTNNLLHFCLSNNPHIADGKNSFLIRILGHQTILFSSAINSPFNEQYQKDYFSAPLIEAAYSFDLLKLLHQSTTLSLNTESNFSRSSVVQHLLALRSGRGIIGTYGFNKRGIFYKKLTFA